MKLIVSAFIALIVSASVTAQPKQGTAAPDIVLPNAKGTATTLSSLKGKVVLIDFWASWCGPCRRSVPALKALYKKYKDKGFEIYGISLDENKNQWQKAVAEDGTQWLHVIDTEGNVATQWKVQYIPNAYLLDKQGKVVVVNAGEEELDKLLQKLLG